MSKEKKAKEVTSVEATPATFTPWTANVDAVLNNPENAVPFVDETKTKWPWIVLPGNAFFDQELGDVIFSKLMKAPVKDYQVLLRLSKLGKTINDISRKLSMIRDALAKDCELDQFIWAEAAMTPETLNSPDYQAKSLAFGQLIQEHIFNKRISLAPLGTLTLDLTSPDGHAKAFLEGSNLSADDVDMLNSLGIVKVVYPDTVDEPAVPETLPAEEHITWAECVEWWEPVIHTDSENLPANQPEENDTTNA